MSNQQAASDTKQEVPSEVLSSPALLFLYYRIEQILGIRAGKDALKSLNEYIEKTCGFSFIENPASYEYILTSREKIYDISAFLTINETYFFRESSHFDLLVSLLPELTKIGRPLQICCAAVSIGCEAYSIAMLLDHYSKNSLNFDFAVDAFDVSSQAIETAKNARYTTNTLRTDGSSWKHILDSYLISDNDEFIVPQDIRRKVRFFPHNIMRGLDKQYDIIFFRNSLIYFTSKNRLSVLNNLAESLHANGLLFLGVSETSSVKHPLLANRYSSDVFYFQKISPASLLEQIAVSTDSYSQRFTPNSIPAINKYTEIIEKTLLSARKEEISINCDEISAFLKKEDGKPNALNVLEALENEDLESMSGASLAAGVVYLFSIQDFDKSNIIIEYLEKNNSSVFTRFLRGEYFFLRGITDEAEKFFHEAAVKDKYFWPAFYRMAVIALDGNRTRFEYKVKKTMESIDLWNSLESDNMRKYECFMGGFSPDYFKRILEKKLA